MKTEQLPAAKIYPSELAAVKAVRATLPVPGTMVIRAWRLAFDALPFTQQLDLIRKAATPEQSQSTQSISS